MLQLFHEVCHQCSKLTTKKYSTSFSAAIRMLHPDLRTPVYNIYGFVRFADEIVDSFHDFDKEELLSRFKKETYEAIENGISLNPILHSFQQTVNHYQIDIALVDAFFKSMESDLHKNVYDQSGYEEYIYGSAEVVGLMCLFVFCDGDKKLYTELKPYAQSLGAAFQKVNFLRDMKDDYVLLERTYFPNVNMTYFNGDVKKQIELEIDQDFKTGLAGIKKLPASSKGGVYLAYVYYRALFKKIKKLPAHKILNERIRINNGKKLGLMINSLVINKMNLV